MTIIFKPLKAYLYSLRISLVLSHNYMIFGTDANVYCRKGDLYKKQTNVRYISPEMHCSPLPSLMNIPSLQNPFNYVSTKTWNDLKPPKTTYSHFKNNYSHSQTI